jgi:hypothetical protein
VLRRLDEADCLSCMREGDFPEAVRAAAPLVAVLLTQSWCPQWIRMRSMLETLELPEGSAAFYFEYDKADFFEEFMSFKESVFGNDQVPYIRYYRSGAISSTGNYADRHEFLSRLGSQVKEE